MIDKTERNWLIRTRSMQILGPVSLEKVKELMEKNSLRSEDELSSGNGYWFCLHETDLVEKYVKQEMIQEFNPITEANTVLNNNKKQSTPSQIESKVERREVEIDIAPLSDKDLEYPDMSSGMEEALSKLPDKPKEVTAEEQDDMTLVIGNNVLEELNSSKPSEIKIKDKELEEPSSNTSQQENPKITTERVIEQAQEVEQKIKKIETKPKKSKSNTKTLSKNDRYLFVLLALFIGLIVGVVYYYKTILNQPIPGFETSWLLDSAHAQNAILSSASKKKVL